MALINKTKEHLTVTVQQFCEFKILNLSQESHGSQRASHRNIFILSTLLVRCTRQYFLLNKISG